MTKHTLLKRDCEVHRFMCDGNHVGSESSVQPEK